MSASKREKPKAQTRTRVEKLLRKRFGKALSEHEKLNPKVTLFFAKQGAKQLTNYDDVIIDFHDAAGTEGPPAILIYSKTGKQTKIDDDSVQPPPPKTSKTDSNQSDPPLVTISYEKHVLPVLERLLKE